MVRTQIQLTEEQAQALKRMAAEQHVSVAEVIRRSVDVLIRSAMTSTTEAERRRRAKEIAGRFRSGRSDIGSQHDHYLAEDFLA